MKTITKNSTVGTKSRAKGRTRIVAAIVTLMFAALAGGSLKSVAADQGQDGDRLALLAKPSVVRVVDGFVGEFYDTARGKTYTIGDGGMGSGFFISSDGFIETNAHVVLVSHNGEDEEKRIVVAKFLSMFAKERDITPEEAAADPAIANAIEVKGFRHIHEVVIADGSEFPFELRQFGSPVSSTSSEDAAIIKIDIANAPILKLGDSDRLRDQDHVTVIGYPSAQESEVLDEKSNLESSITDGKISARRTATDGHPIFQTTAPSTHGNSGGPVLNDAGEAVGLLTFGGKGEVSGFAFFVAENTAQPYVNRAGVTNELGPVDRAYRDGLELFFQHHYAAALEKFEEVKGLFGHHSKIDALIAESQQKAGGPEDAPLKPGGTGPRSEPATESASPNLILAAAGGGLFFLIVVGVAGALLIKSARSRKSRPGIPAAPRPAAGAAILRGVAGGYAGYELPLDAGPITIGRDPSLCQLVFPAGSNGISKIHCKLTYNSAIGAVLLEDCNSTNGTFLQSGEPVSPGMPRNLGPNARFYLNDPTNMFEVQIPSANPMFAGGGVLEKTVPLARVRLGPEAGVARAVLLGINGEYAGRSIAVDSNNLMMGRDAGACQIVFPPFMEKVSKRHCAVRFNQTNGKFVVSDLGSSNGTFVISGGMQSQIAPGQSREGNPGDRFFLGSPDALFEFRLER